MYPTDLSAVTETLKKLINEILDENQETMIETTAAPPDASLTENKVSVYLYHVLESPEFKNLPPPTGASGPVPIQHAPMGLILQYIITVIHGASETVPNDGAIAEQRILGYVARAIHDFPVITAQTTLPGSTELIMHEDLRLQKSSLRLNLRPATREETIAFWSSSDDKLPRLSLFVEVRVAILDPRPPLQLPGIVLTVGNFVFPGGPPQLTRTRSVIRFFPPESVSTELQSVQATPARPTMLPLSGDPTYPAGDDFNPDPAFHPNLFQNSLITIEASDIRLGVRFLVLKSGSHELTIKMDGADNPDWAFQVSSSLVSFSLRNSVLPSSLDGVVASTPVSLFPGSYTARVLVKSPNFGDKPQSSNDIAFTAIPQIVAINGVGVATDKEFEIVIAGSFFGKEDKGFISEREIVLAVRGVVLDPISITGTLTEGTFKIVDSGDENVPTNLLRFRLPDEIAWPVPPDPPADPPILLPVNLVVRGAPATPAWLESS